MENAVDALKIAFALFIFVMALSLCMYMFTKAIQTSDIVLESSDVTTFMEYVEPSDMIGEDRIVGLETIIPTLYKYYKENYTVVFLESDGSPMELYTSQTNELLWSGHGTDNAYTNRYYNNNYDKRICAFDVDEETRRHEPWTGNTNYYKQNLDMFLSGGTFVAPSGNGMDYNYSDRKINGWGRQHGFIEEYKDRKFRESLGEYTFNSVTDNPNLDEDSPELTEVEGKEKRVIIYTLIN